MLTKVCIVKAIVFPVVMYKCESWTIKKTEHWRIDALELWCWRRLFRVPWTARRSSQSILKEIKSEYSLAGLMLKLKLQYFGHLMQRADPFGKDPDAGNDWGPEEKGTTEDEVVGWHHQLNGHEFEQMAGDSKGQGNLVCCSPWSCRVRHDWTTEQQFCTPRPNLSAILGISWLSTFAFQPLCWKGHLFFLLLVLGLVGLQRTVWLQFLQH